MEDTQRLDLTYWAAYLVDIKHNTKIADLACGSGGFLVEAASMDDRMTGIEISPNWARVAAANCLLHNSRPEILIGNSLSVLGRGQLGDSFFDVILINPPFGAKVDKSLIPVAFDFKFSGRSETVLSGLAMNHLAELGQMLVFFRLAPCLRTAEESKFCVRDGSKTVSLPPW